MKLKYLTLANFRSIKNQTIRMDGKNTTIKGSNGTGKTTVANAISYLLTDAPATDEKDFSPKTTGEHNLNHIAEMTVEDDDGVETTYTKDFHEVWKKKRGSQTAEFAGHEVTYAINGVPAKKKDYEAAMQSLCGGDPKRALMLSRVGYFAEDMPQADRRKVLFDIVGDIPDDEVMQAADLMDLKDILRMPGKSDKLYTPDEYLQIAKVQRRDLNKKLDELPERIDELKRTLPAGAWDEDQETSLEEKIKNLEKQKADILSQTPATKTEALKAAIAGMKAEIEAGREKYLIEKNKATAAADNTTGAIRSAIHQIEDSLHNLTKEKTECEDSVREMERKRAELLLAFDRLKEKKWTAEQEVCPTCGQSLPPDVVKELRGNFLAEMAKEKARINEEGKTCSKQAIEDKKQHIEDIDETCADLNAKLEAQRKKLEEAKAGSVTMQPFEDTLAYKTSRGRLEELEIELADAEAGWDKPDTSEIDKAIEEAQEEKAAHKAAKAAKVRIGELEQEQMDTSHKLDHVDKGINMCEDFFRAKVRLVSQKVDDCFEHKVGFLLFKDQINGGLKECCEPLVPDAEGNLIEYKMANTAARVNAGLEIIKVLSKHYGVYLPIVVDRAESVTDLLPMPDHQVIRLVVSAEDKELNVEVEG